MRLGETQREWPQISVEILSRVKRAAESVDRSSVEMLVSAISNCTSSGGRIFFAASGRSYNVIRNFARRLAMEPLKIFTHDLCGSSFPPVMDNDLLIACSATGYTKYVSDFVTDWSGLNKKIFLITSNDDGNDPDNVLWRKVEKKIFVPAVSEQYKSTRKEGKKIDKYSIKEDFSEQSYLDTGICHFVFELATLTLLEAVHHELVKLHQQSK